MHSMFHFLCHARGGGEGGISVILEDRKLPRTTVSSLFLFKLIALAQPNFGAVFGGKLADGY